MKVAADLAPLADTIDDRGPSSSSAATIAESVADTIAESVAQSQETYK